MIVTIYVIVRFVLELYYCYYIRYSALCTRIILKTQKI